MEMNPSLRTRIFQRFRSSVSIPVIKKDSQSYHIFGFLGNRRREG